MNPGHYAHFFTVFIPTFDRAHTLPRALSSIERQTFTDFEVIIIDDGSTDNTRELIEAWTTSCSFPVRYHRQENRGRHVARNVAMEHAKGFMTVILDSDDVLVPNALERLNHHWDGIPEQERERFAGIASLCASMNGEISGNRYPRDVMDSTYLELRRQYRISGEKKLAIRTAVLKEFPFPEFEGERYIQPGLVWKRMAHEYKLRFVNEIIHLTDPQPDGLSSDRFRLRMENPRGHRLCLLEEANLHVDRRRKFALLKRHARYVRFSLHGGIGFIQQARDIDSKLLWVMSLPMGTLGWFLDRMRLKLTHYSSAHE